MQIRLYPLQYMGAEMVAEDDCTEYFIVEYAFCEEYMMWHKIEIFYPIITQGSSFVHNLN